MIKITILKGQETSYNLERKNVKNINLRIKANQSICVSANPQVSYEIIEDFLQSKADYILKAATY